MDLVKRKPATIVHPLHPPLLDFTKIQTIPLNKPVTTLTKTWKPGWDSL